MQDDKTQKDEMFELIKKEIASDIEELCENVAYTVNRGLQEILPNMPICTWCKTCEEEQLVENVHLGDDDKLWLTVPPCTCTAEWQLGDILVNGLGLDSDEVFNDRYEEKPRYTEKYLINRIKQLKALGE